MSSLGPTIIDGALQYVSPSAHDKWERCQRRWGFRYILRLKEPTGKNAALGSAGHGRIEHYLTTSEDVLTDIEYPGRVWIPRPWSVEVEPTIDVSKPILSYTQPGGHRVAFVGKLDCANTYGRYVDTQGDEQIEPFAEVIDWKYSGEPSKWGATAQQLAEPLLPMAAYAQWVLSKLDEDGRDDIKRTHVRLSHVYFGLRKRESFKRSALVPVEKITARLHGIAPTIAAMATGAKVSDPNELKPNFDACNDYHQQCPFILKCNRSKGDAFRSLFGHVNSTQEIQVMGILDQAISGDDAVKKLQADEAAAKVVAVRGYMASIAKLNAGTPQYTGDAAQAVAAANGWQYSGAGYAGAGALAGIVLDTVDKLAGLAKEAEAKVAGSGEDTPPPAPPPPAVNPQTENPLTPPDSPAPTPTSIATPVPPEVSISLGEPVKGAAEAHAAQVAADAPPAEHVPASKRKGPDGKLLKKGAVCELLDAAEAELAVGGRSPSDTVASDDIQKLWVENGDLKQKCEAMRVEIASHKSLLAQVDHTAKLDAPGIELWVDCLPSDAIESLDSYIDTVSAELAKRQGAPHLLCGDKDSALGYGQWEGALVSTVREFPPPAGRYSMLYTRGNKIKEAVVDALRPLCTALHRGV